jgi:arabinose-5-phosphate isomerase
MPQFEMPTVSQAIDWGRQVLDAESSAIAISSQRLSSEFYAAVCKILECSGKVVTAGLGKSGYIARKMASTLASTGTPSFFLHPAEAMHGDSGMLASNDCLIAIAHSGETREVLGLARFARQLGVPVIAVTGNIKSSLNQLACVGLDGSIDQEADSLGLAPTVSSTLALALCDALAVAVMRGRGFSTQEFAKLHPGGALGRSLATVEELMHVADRLSPVSLVSNFNDVVAAITKYNFGIVPVTDGDGFLVGAISDGDIRRALQSHHAHALSLVGADLMTKNPKTIFADEPAMNAVKIMEHHSILSIFVAARSEPRKCIGIIRLHDLTAAKII